MQAYTLLFKKESHLQNVRMGHHLGDKDNYWTMGAGYTTQKFNIFAAAKLTPSSEQPNIYMLNLGLNIK